MDEGTAHYRTCEFRKVEGDDLKMKITGDVDRFGIDGTRWLNITRAEFEQITAILTGKKN